MTMTMQDERKRSQSLQMHWEGAEEGDTDRSELHHHDCDDDLDYDDILFIWSRRRYR